MLGFGFHETESLLASHHAEQQPTWDELEAGSDQLCWQSLLGLHREPPESSMSVKERS
jgi:hypothetical protein